MAIVFSICIPRVFNNITEARICAILNRLALGTIDRIDIVAKSNDRGDSFNRVFVHFSIWNDSNSDARSVKQKLDAGDRIKIVYDDPWYWLISKSNSPVPTKRPGPYIDLTHRNRNSIPDTTVVDDATQIFTEQDQINIDTFCPLHPELEKIEKEIDECLTHDVNMTHWENELDELECIKENQSHAI